MSESITFTVPGNPATKGSMRAMNHPTTGKAFVVHSSPQGLAAWTASIKLMAARECDGRQPTNEAVHMTVCWDIARPQGHWGTGRNAGKIKTRAPQFPTSKRSGDLDKLERALLDALTGIVYVDDSQVVSINASKRYAIGTGSQMIVKIEVAG